jgi:hypothetical protein
MTAPTNDPKPTRGKKPREDYPVQTGQEANAMLSAVADGKIGRHWQDIFEADARIHQVPGAAHRVRLVLSDGERAMGIPVEALADATARCDADDDFMLLYISRLLVPSQPLPPGTLPYAYVNLDDVIKAIGWYPQNTDQRAEMRRRVWQFIKFVSRAHIIGERTYSQRDKMTGKDLETYIESPPWVLGGKKRESVPPPAPLFGDDDPPLSVEIVVTEMWARLTMMPDTAQFLPLGEVLGAIPGAKPSGAWARVIGLALSNFWRRKPREAISGKMKPTRREILEHYTPSTGAVADVLASPNPRRALEYWAGALRILVECEFLADEGEAAMSYEEMRDGLNGYGWQESWLNGVADVAPGPAMVAAVTQRAEALPQKTAKTKTQRKKR